MLALTSCVSRAISRTATHLAHILGEQIPVTEPIKEYHLKLERWGSVIMSTSGITADSRLVKPNMVYVAIQGFKDNGNKYIAEAITRGACMIITDERLDIIPDIPVIVVTNARRTLAHLCAWFYGYPAEHLHITAITGTNGKTTTTSMIDNILITHGLITGTVGTDQIKIADARYPSALTTPDAPTLQKSLRNMLQQHVSHVTMEASAQGIELERTACLPVQCGILTNITPDHLDFYGSMPHYIAAKERFLQVLAHNAPLCVNADDPLCMDIANRYRGPVVTYGLYAKADVYATDIALNATDSSFIIHARETMISRFTGGMDSCIACHLQVPGLHNIYNALAAAAGCLVNQILPESIQNGLARFKGVDRRMQIREMRDFTVLDDTALNPSSIDTVFETVRQLSYRQIIIIAAIRGNRGTEMNRENALRLAQWAQTYHVQRVIVTSSHSHLDRLNRVSPAEEAIFLKTLTEANISFAHFKELPDAIGLGLQHIGAGDLLVLIGAHGMDDGVNILESILPPIDPAYFQNQITIQQ